MKRDMELIRKILVAVEDHPEPDGSVPLRFDGYSDQEVSYHVKLLSDQGLIEATDCRSLQDFSLKARSLTWGGHDFVEAIRDDTRWNKVKKWVLDAGKILTLETAIEAAKTLFLSRLD